MRTQDAMNALQADRSRRFLAVNQRTRVSIISLLEQETNSPDFTREEITTALRALLLENDPHELLDRQVQNESTTQTRSHDAFYVPRGHGPDWTDVMLLNMAYNGGGGSSTGSSGDCNDCNAEAAAGVCFLATLFSAFVCCAYACENSDKTCAGPETSFVKSVKVFANLLTFLVVSGGAGYQAYTHQNQWQGESSSNTLYTILAGALSFSGGMASALLVSWLNKENRCLPSAPEKYVLPGDIRDELEQISRLLQGEWLGEPQRLNEPRTKYLQRCDQTRAFIREAVQTYIKRAYQPKGKVDIVVDPGLTTRLLAPGQQGEMERGNKDEPPAHTPRR